MSVRLVWTCPEPAAVVAHAEGQVNVAVAQYFAALNAWCKFWWGVSK